MSLSNFEPLSTTRLLIRPVEEADLPQLLPISGDPVVTHHLPYETWASMDQAHAWLAASRKRCAEGLATQLVIEREADAVIVGTAILFAYDALSARAEIGYVLGQAHWHRGYAREAVGALVAHAFTPLGLRRLEAQVNPANRASCKLIESLGFKLEGHLRDRYTSKGRTYGVNLYGRLASD